MKLSLFRFFAVVLPILFIGVGQPSFASINGSKSIQNTRIKTDFTNHSIVHEIKSNSLLDDSKADCFVEDTNEDELVILVFKKNVHFENGFISVFGLSLPNFVQHNHINKVAFSKRLPFCSSTKSSALYQVFRI